VKLESSVRQIRLRIFLTLLISEIFLAILIPLMIWLALNKGLSPLREMQGNLEHRKSDDLSALPVR
jgi:two-component system, OmpR family, sensor histidine kinase TctE